MGSLEAGSDHRCPPSATVTPSATWLPAPTIGYAALTQRLHVHVGQDRPLLGDLGPAAVGVLNPLGRCAVVGARVLCLGTPQHHAVLLSPLLGQPQLPGGQPLGIGSPGLHGQVRPEPHHFLQSCSPHWCLGHRSPEGHGQVRVLLRARPRQAAQRQLLPLMHGQARG